jgi:hypothetical protein
VRGYLRDTSLRAGFAVLHLALVLLSLLLLAGVFSRAPDDR